MEEGLSFRASFVLGFHGCDEAVAESLLLGRTDHLRPSQNSFDWLGSGIYFWESSPDRALQYARTSVRRPSPAQVRISKPAVVGAIIELGHCLDLLDSQYFPLVRGTYELLKGTIQAKGLRMPRNRPLTKVHEHLLRDLDCAVINFIHESRRKEGMRPFDSVRAAFIEGKPLYEGASFYDRSHVQICVRNVSCIKGYFRPVG